MPKGKTPLERAIDATKDRRAKYDKAMRDQGYVRMSLWVHGDLVETIRELVNLARDEGVTDREGLLKCWGTGTWLMELQDKGLDQ